MKVEKTQKPSETDMAEVWREVRSTSPDSGVMESCLVVHESAQVLTSTSAYPGSYRDPLSSPSSTQKFSHSVLHGLGKGELGNCTSTPLLCASFIFSV